MRGFRPAAPVTPGRAYVTHPAPILVGPIPEGSSPEGAKLRRLKLLLLQIAILNLRVPSETDAFLQ